MWQFDFAPVLFTAPRSFVTIGFGLALPSEHPLAECTYEQKQHQRQQQLPATRLCCSYSVEHAGATLDGGLVRADFTAG